MDGGLVVVIICFCGIATVTAPIILVKGAEILVKGAEKIKKIIRYKSFIKFTSSIYLRNKSSYKMIECIICLTDYTENNKYSELYCGHTYHTSCIKKWMNYREICPLCNTKLIKKKKCKIK